MVNTWIIPELGTQFTDSFSKIALDYIFNNWSYTTGNLAKPTTMTGQDNKIEFRRGFVYGDKPLSVNTIQGSTEINQYIQMGQKIQTSKTQVLVTLTVQTLNLDDPDDILTDMEQEIQRLCGQYKQIDQVSGDIRGIKDFIYEIGERNYLPSDSWDKSEWSSTHRLVLWYQQNDTQ